MRRTDVDLGGGIELLMFGLGSDLESKEWEDSEWINLLTRMLSVESKLTAATRRGLHQNLLGFVSVGQTKPVEQWWTPGFARQPVLGELGLGT